MINYNENLAIAAQNKIEELVGTQHQINGIGYSSSGDDLSYQINYHPSKHYVYQQDNLANTDVGIINDWSQQLNRLADPVMQKEDDMLKQMPIEMAIERMKMCANCTFANAVHCMHRFKRGESCSPCPCNQRDMLIYGHCPKFKSTAQVDIELAAEGIDDGKE